MSRGGAWGHLSMVFFVMHHVLPRALFGVSITATYIRLLACVWLDYVGQLSRDVVGSAEAVAFWVWFVHCSEWPSLLLIRLLPYVGSDYAGYPSCDVVGSTKVLCFSGPV